MFGCRHAPLILAADVVRALADHYGEPHRAYHNAAHVAEVLGWYDRVADEVGWLAPDDVYLAAVFHDAIYVPGAKDNEARSAALARTLGGASANAAALIELTARHGHIAPGDVDHDAAHFLDCDTAILGAAPPAFAAYDAAIAVEFGYLPPAAFRAGRQAFLAHLLARPRIFLTPMFHQLLDAPARANLATALARVA